MASNVPTQIQFEPGCWRYVTVQDLRDSMTEDEKITAGLTGLTGTLIMAKITWSKEACQISHGQGFAHGPPHHLAEREAEPRGEEDTASIISISSMDSEETVLYSVKEEEVSSSLDTSTWEEDDWDGDEWEANGGLDFSEEDEDREEPEIVYVPAGAEKSRDEESDGFSFD